MRPIRFSAPCWVLCLIVLLAGCATDVPLVIRTPPADNPTLAAVRADPAAYVGHAVRWGGNVAGVENRSGHSLLEVVARPLQGDGRPDSDAPSPGRFLARVSGFLEPQDYPQGRAVTVAGSVAGGVSGEVGEYAYVYPLVYASTLHRWLPRPAYRPGYDPFWDPFWGPYWHDPWYPYPYGFPYRRPWWRHPYYW